MKPEQPSQVGFCEINFVMNPGIKRDARDIPDQAMTTKEAPQHDESQKTTDPTKEKVRVKSKGRKIAIGLIISLSAVMFGYSIKEITSVPMENLVQIYSIPLDESIASTVLIGILPIAAVLGAIITKVLMKRFRRLSGIYIFTFVNVGAIVLVNINLFLTLCIGRLLEGVCIGFYSAIAPIYLREIAPRELRKMLGLFFSLGKVFGILLVIAIQLILSAIGDAAFYSWGYRIVLSMTALLSVLQSVLIFCFGSDTPTEMIEKGKH